MVDSAVRRRMKKLRLASKVNPPSNALRHSYASYSLARSSKEGLGELSKRMGNSEAVCKRHYLETLTREEGAAWFKIRLALEIIAQACGALVALEAHGLVHRDLKPANLMLVEGPELMIKVIDFGLAKGAAIAGSESDISHGGFVGTPSFASPEQFTSTSVDVRSDLYSLGITLWEMLTGQTPFRGTPVEVMHQHQHASLPLDLLETVPQPVVILLEILLEKDPARRFQNPAELLQAVPRITDAIHARRRITRQSLQKTPLTASRVGTHKLPARLGPEKISVAKLPVTGSDISGREQDIAYLDAAWANKDINVVTIVAWAGVGKLLSALVHFFEDRRWGSPVETAAEGQSLTAEDKLFILMQAGLYLSAMRGMGAPETRTCYERAEPLCRSLNHPRLLYMALSGQFRYTLMTDKLTAAIRIAKRLHSLAQEQNDTGLMLGAYGALACTFYFLGEFETARQHARHGVQLWRSAGAQSPAEEYLAPIASCLICGAMCEWHFGEIAFCRTMMDEGNSVAKELKDTNALAQALSWAAAVAYFERDPAEADRLASQLIELSTRHNFAPVRGSRGVALGLGVGAQAGAM